MNIFFFFFSDVFSAYLQLISVCRTFVEKDADESQAISKRSAGRHFPVCKSPRLVKGELAGVEQRNEGVENIRTQMARLLA